MKTKHILKATSTPAHADDSWVFEKLIEKGANAVLAVGVSHSAEHDAYLTNLDAQQFLVRETNRSHPWSPTEPHHKTRASEVGVNLRESSAKGNPPVSEPA